VGIVQFIEMAGADCEGHLYPFAQKALFDFCLQKQIETGTCEQQVWHRARITQFAPPGTGVVGAGLQQTALFQIGTPVIVPKEIATVDYC